MEQERPYAFRKDLNTVHRPGRRNAGVSPSAGEMMLDDSWDIVVQPDASPVVLQAAVDLQSYLFISMEVSVRLRKSVRCGSRCVMIGTGKGTVPGMYAVDCRADRILLTGSDDRGAAQGCYYLEDLMNLKEAPVLSLGKVSRKPVFSPRMVHSGWQLDHFPDAYLNRIAHSGFNAILVFADGINRAENHEFMDFNDLIDRAALFGIDVYFYSKFHNEKHPAEPDAEQFYEQSFGRLFEYYPRAKGLVLVGESCEFPSRDPHTTGKLRGVGEPGIRPKKPRPGWWPCSDFPEWLSLIQGIVRRHSSQAEIVFWTYNWGYTPEAERLRLIASLPEDITLLVTYEMFEQTVTRGVRQVCMDYSIYNPDPSKIFISEAAAAKKRNIRLYTMCNTAGSTWDFGTVPYMPVPNQWMKRHRTLLDCNRKYALCGLMEGHHYGFYPSVVSEMAKWNFYQPAPDPEEMLEKIALRDFGAQAAAHVLKAWKYWSDCCPYFPPTNEDQYGPARVGPSYPLIFHPDISRDFRSQEIQMPADSSAYNGSGIVKTFYHPYENEQQSAGIQRYPLEFANLRKALKLWRKGTAEMRRGLETTPENKRKNAERALGLGLFIENSIVTMIHVKEWWLLNQKLILEPVPKKAFKILDRLEELAQDEILNAERTIPLVEADSRLGWEPTMEYMTDREHLEWKIRQVESTLEYEIKVYRKIVALS